MQVPTKSGPSPKSHSLNIWTLICFFSSYKCGLVMFLTARLCLCGTCGLRSCRISPPRFLAECGRSPLNQGSFVVLYFVLFNFSGLYLVSVACHLSF